MDKEVMFEKNTMIVSETNTNGLILYANEDFCEISGYTKEELIGKPHNILRHPDMPRAAFKDLWEHIKSDRVWNGTVKNRTRNGDYYWVNATIYSVTKKNGEKRFLSVRIKPTKYEVKEAVKLYETIN